MFQLILCIAGNLAMTGSATIWLVIVMNYQPFF